MWRRGGSRRKIFNDVRKERRSNNRKKELTKLLQDYINFCFSFKLADNICNNNKIFTNLF